jgi:hypothetical protein
MGPAQTGGGVDANAQFAAQAGCHGVEPGLLRLQQLLVVVAEFVRGQRQAWVEVEGPNHMQHVQFGLVLPGKVCGTLNHPIGEGRKISGGNDAADAGHGGSPGK